MLLELVKPSCHAKSHWFPSQPRKVTTRKSRLLALPAETYVPVHDGLAPLGCQFCESLHADSRGQDSTMQPDIGANNEQNGLWCRFRRRFRVELFLQWDFFLQWFLRCSCFRIYPSGCGGRFIKAKRQFQRPSCRRQRPQTLLRCRRMRRRTRGPTRIPNWQQRQNLIQRQQIQRQQMRNRRISS